MQYVWTPFRKVFAYWAIAILFGFVATHFYQVEQINYFWTLISLIGLYLMSKYMFNKNKPLNNTFWVWVVILLIGMLVSFGIFYLDALVLLAGYLGVFWLALMGIGHILTAVTFGRKDFYITGILQILVAILCFYVVELSVYQYIVTGVVGSLSMARFLK